ncbi:dTDP-glucose pyrophosphorylase [Saliniradius amylolyticus]|nr:dTDP-glucose pyrophosphorylase [Saliniradius amylolyticus]
MNESNGAMITGLAELKQRIQRCLRTRKGTLPLRPLFGSNLPELIDAKMTPGFDVDVYAEVAATLAEPANEFRDEFTLHRSYLEIDGHNTVITLEGEYLISGEPVTLEGVRPWA